MSEHTTKASNDEEILALLEQGKPEAAIIETHPGHESEVRDLLAAIKALGAGKDIRPDAELLEKVLRQLPAGEPIKSPFLKHVSTWQKWGAIVGVFIFFATGGLLADHYLKPNQAVTGSSTGIQVTSSSVNDTSNAALQQDLNSIDSQMNGLDSDNSQIDQALGT
jgi:hypothetical protein